MRSSSTLSNTETEKEFAAVLAWMPETVSDNVKQVRLSSRLTISPAWIVGNTYYMTRNWRRRTGPSAKRRRRSNTSSNSR